MRQLIKHISILCSLGIAMSSVLLGSCTSDKFSEGKAFSAAELGGKVNLSLSVGIGNTEGIRQTRDGEESGNDNNFTYEQSDIPWELINTLRVIIVRPDYTVEVNRLVKPKDLNPTSLLNASNVDADELKFYVSTDQGYVDNDAQTCTERKRIYLIVNEASLNDLKSNVTGDGESLTALLQSLKPAYYPSKKEEEEGKKGELGDKLDPLKMGRWIIFNNWAESGDEETNVNDLLATPIIDNTGETKKYIPMTEFFDIDVVSSWNPVKDGESSGGEDDDEIVMTIPNQNVDLFVTRNFVKFLFSASSDDETFDVTGIRFSNLSQKEYLFPCNTIYSPEKAVNKVENREIVSFSTPGAADNLRRPYIFAPASFKVSVPEEGTTAKPVVYAPQVYFCETQNFETNEQGKPIYQVGVDLHYYNADGTFTDISFDKVELPNLPYSLPRNTIVKVHFTIHERSHIEATVTVYPYTAVTLNPEFGFIIPVEGVKISMVNQDGDVKEYECSEGQSFNLIGSVSPADANNKRISWSSSDESIATVTNYGLVTALKEGEAVIRVTSVDNPEKYAECKVKVNPKVTVESVSLSPATWNARITESVILVATISPENATIQGLEWESEDNNVAYVTPYGIVTAVGPGRTKITCTAKDNPEKKATCEVTVAPKVSVTNINIVEGNQTLIEGGQFSFTATVSPDNATNKGITWTSSNNDVATVTNYGLVTAVAPAKDPVTITATSSDNPSLSATRTITVTAKIPVTDIKIMRSNKEVSEFSLSLAGTKSVDIRARIYPENATYKNIVWETSDAKVAIVGKNTDKYDDPSSDVVNVYAEGAGNATITAYAKDNPDIKAEFHVTVTE